MPTPKFSLITTGQNLTSSDPEGENSYQGIGSASHQVYVSK